MVLMYSNFQNLQFPASLYKSSTATVNNFITEQVDVSLSIGYLLKQQ